MGTKKHLLNKSKESLLRERESERDRPMHRENETGIEIKTNLTRIKTERRTEI